MSSGMDDGRLSPEEAAAIHTRAKKGVRLLLARQLVVLFLTFGAGIALARLLRPSEFGLYAIATFVVEILGLFGTFGLAPSFIQRRREPSDDDLAVGFTLQQIVATVLVGVIVVIAPWVMALFPDAPAGSTWLIRVLGFSLYLTSWRSISA